MNFATLLNESTTQTSGESHFVWKISGTSAQVRISLELIGRIREYLAKPSGQNTMGELGGLLLGKPHPLGVQIDDVFNDGREGWPFTTTHSLPNQIAELKRLAGGLSVVGYYRCDSRKGICLYREDLELIGECFPSRSNVFLIINRDSQPRATAGFFFWEKDDIISSCAFLEFDFNGAPPRSSVERSPNGNSNLPVKSTPTSVKAFFTSVQPPHRQEDRGLDLFTSARDPAASVNALVPSVKSLFHTRGRELAARIPRPVFASLAAALTIAFVVFLLVSRPGSHSPLVVEPAELRLNPHPLVAGLSVARAGTDVRIMWNGRAPIVRDARDGLLTIKDGGTVMPLPLTPMQLKSGQLLYTPRGDMLEVTFEVLGYDGAVMRESVVTVSDARALSAKMPETPIDGIVIPAEPQVPVDGNATPESAKDPEGPATQLAVPADAPAPSAEQPKPVREFTPPVLVPERAAAPSIETPPPPLASRIEAAPLNAPVIQPPVLFAAAPNPPAPSTSPLTDRARPRQEDPKPAYRPPVPIRQVAPVVPPNLKRMLTTRVNIKVRAQIDAAGNVTSAEPLAINGPVARILGNVAANAAKMWAFAPASDGNKAVASELTIEFTFAP